MQINRRMFGFSLIASLLARPSFAKPRAKMQASPEAQRLQVLAALPSGAVLIHGPLEGWLWPRVENGLWTSRYDFLIDFAPTSKEMENPNTLAAFELRSNTRLFSAELKPFFANAWHEVASRTPEHYSKNWSVGDLPQTDLSLNAPYWVKPQATIAL